MLGTTIPALHVSSFNPSSNLISTYLISAVMYVFRWRKPRRGKVKLLSTFPLLVSVMLSVNFSPWDLDGPCVPVWEVWPLFWKWWEPEGFEAGKWPDTNRFIALEKSLWRLGRWKGMYNLERAVLQAKSSSEGLRSCSVIGKQEKEPWHIFRK